MGRRLCRWAPMMRLARRVWSFIGRLVWMTRLSRNPVIAFGLLLKIRTNRKAVHAIQINNRPVCFRASDEQALREVFVDNEYAFLRDCLMAAKGAKILDIGAHIGTFAMWCLNIAPGTTILSIEADPHTFEVLRRNAENFRGTASRWSVQHAAAGARDGEVLKLSGSGPSMSHRISPTGEVAVGSISLRSLIDLLAPDGGTVDVMKVDIEGSEEQFLCECPEALGRVNALVAELHPNLCDAARVEAALREEFDSVVSIGGRKSTKPLLFCRRSEGRHE